MSDGNAAPDQVAARLHTCLLNLLVRISMEPSVRQVRKWFWLVVNFHALLLNFFNLILTDFIFYCVFILEDELHTHTHKAHTHLLVFPLQSPLLQTLLLESEGFAWWLIDGDSFQRVVNWWVMSCDPRIVLSLPDRNPVDISIIQWVLNDLHFFAALYVSYFTSFLRTFLLEKVCKNIHAFLCTQQLFYVPFCITKFVN